MDNQNDFTYDKENYKGLPAFVKELHDNGMHYIPLIDPGVSASEKPGTYPPYDEGISMDIFVRNSSGQPFIGKVSVVGITYIFTRFFLKLYRLTRCVLLFFVYKMV